jgi:16S rRNA (guanine527-N7)-methyltransferase
MLTEPFPAKQACEILLNKGLQTLSLSASDRQCAQLLAYIQLLDKWNRHFNLTSVRAPVEMVSRHLLDSLSIYPYLHGDRIIDVGTGAGLPGIPLSVMAPENSFFLLDSNQKKQVFVSQVVKSLSLKNVQCVHATVKTYQPEQKFSTIVTRAFAPVAHMIELTAHLLADDGLFLAMMGKPLQQEQALPPGYKIERIVSLQVPGEHAQRHLSMIAKDKKHQHKD